MSRGLGLAEEFTGDHCQVLPLVDLTVAGQQRQRRRDVAEQLVLGFVGDPEAAHDQIGIEGGDRLERDRGVGDGDLLDAVGLLPGEPAAVRRVARGGHRRMPEFGEHVGPLIADGHDALRDAVDRRLTELVLDRDRHRGGRLVVGAARRVRHGVRRGLGAALRLGNAVRRSRTVIIAAAGGEDEPGNRGGRREAPPPSDQWDEPAIELVDLKLFTHGELSITY